MRASENESGRMALTGGRLLLSTTFGYENATLERDA